ncbi:hypothetical protein EYZ11_012893 [Aspergillus tanneri]|uniref:Uncharacterized protein n=1 Tax=Aspergillus tanneri TaxID=1220188 RepID=A0A4S3IZ20_9EURO|nr:hypothetical protein EYZ11_012893 [Aspergillus tanneri]
MKEAKGGRRTGSQDSIMNKTSAMEVAVGIGWTDEKNSDKPLSGNSLAEWLHISAYAYGGLTGNPNNARTSQMKLNFVLGTAETNSLMLRYEAAWTQFFLMEQSLREIRDGRRVDVQGQLTFVNNIGQTIQNRTEVNGNPIVTPIQFDQNAWLRECFSHCPWMSFGLHYNVSMDGMSSVLDWNKPTFSIQFFPFARPFFTKEEAMVDMLLLERAYDAKRAKLQPGPPMARALTLSAHSPVNPSGDARLGREEFTQMELRDVLELLPRHEPLTVDGSMFSGLPLRSSVETTGRE